MAFLIKQHQPTRKSTGQYDPVIAQTVRVEKSAATLPATTTQNIFTVSGGRVLVKGIIGEVTTAVQAQVCNLKVTVVPTTGTAYDVAANVDINADEIGTLYSVEGDGTALLTVSSGAIQAATGTGFIVSPGTIRIATSATNTGATKWTLYYEPLDPEARVASA